MIRVSSCQQESLNASNYGHLTITKNSPDFQSGFPFYFILSPFDTCVSTRSNTDVRFLRLPWSGGSRSLSRFDRAHTVTGFLKLSAGGRHIEGAGEKGADGQRWQGSGGTAPVREGSPPPSPCYWKSTPDARQSECTLGSLGWSYTPEKFRPRREGALKK